MGQRLIGNSAYSHWIRASIRENKPYDRFVRDLLTASGSNFRTPPVNFYRAMQSKEPPGIAQTVALTFMGTRAENWPKTRLAGMAGFFSQLAYKETGEWKEEIVFFKPSVTPVAAVFPDGTTARLAAGRDPREVFADWLVTPKNDGPTSDFRFNYLYRPDELEEWVPAIREVADRGTPVHVLLNNNRSNYAVANAFDFGALLDAGLPRPPQPVIDTLTGRDGSVPSWIAGCRPVPELPVESSAPRGQGVLDLDG